MIESPARIHVLLARNSPQAVVIRRGPSKHTAVIGWDRTNDSFQIGQWLKGTIYHYRSDACGSIKGNSMGSLAVENKYRNKGYGTALAVFMTNEIIRAGYECAVLSCEVKNKNARHIYDKIGYKITETSYSSFKKLFE